MERGLCLPILIALRKEKEIIAKGSIAFIEKENPDILGYKKMYGSEELVVLNNLTGKEVAVAAEDAWKDYRKILGNYSGDVVKEDLGRGFGDIDGADMDKDSGNVDKENLTEASDYIILRPYETVVLDSGR